jgi:hypothetical protein
MPMIRPSQRLQAGDGLAPWLLARGVDERVTGRGELVGGRLHGGGVCDVELEAGLWHRTVGRPLARAEHACAAW